MPPKKPKIDPEAKQREYDAFLQSQQYKKMLQLYQDITVNMVNLHGPQDAFLSETSQDCHVSGKHQILWDKIYELAVLMKVKPPFKKIQHEWMRSAYFGQKIKVNTDDVIYVLDGIVCEFEPEYSDAQRHIRQTVHKRITNLIRDKQQTMDIQNFTKSRTEIKKGIQQLFGLLKNYIKKPFKIIYQDKFMEVLKPFSDLLEINMKLVLYQLKYDTEDTKYINDFKKKAIVDRYCQCLQRILYILMTYHTKPIQYKIKSSNIFKKLDFTNLSKIQIFYLTPFSDAFSDMKKGLCAQFTTGINFWKVPIEKNVKFVQHLKILVNWQIVTQRHFGVALVRDQINFAADALLCIDKANDLSKKYMLIKDPNSMEVAIPRLVAFKTLQHMRQYRDKQQQIKIKQQQRAKLLGTTTITQPKPLQLPQQQKSITISPNGTKTNFAKNPTPPPLSTNDPPKFKSIVKGMTLLKKDTIEQEKQKLGRYWIWENYCDDEFKNKVIQPAVEKMRHINKAVQQDIEDAIIRQGMLPRKDRHDEQRINATDTLKNMKTIHNAQKSQNMRRPPQLWNFPKVIQEQHKFRSIAQPKKCYIDGRIEQLDSEIAKIGVYLMNYNKKDWNELIRRVVDFYAGTPNSSPLYE